MGGTFNPIHLGHLIMAESVMHSLRADGMLFIPADRHHFKPEKELSNFAERVEMVRLAIEGNSRFLLEQPPTDSPFTIDLIDCLQNTYPAAEFFLPMGSDIIDEFDAWRRREEIEHRIRIVIAARPGYKLKTRTDGVLKGAERVMIPQYDISSSEIRRRVKARLSIRYMVPEAVRQYIHEKGLYVQ